MFFVCLFGRKVIPPVHKKCYKVPKMNRIKNGFINHAFLKHIVDLYKVSVEAKP